MANILTKIIQIRNSILGIDVRESIASGIETINTEIESTTSRQNALETTFNALVINAGNSNAEIVQARGTHPNLKDRLDSFSEENANGVISSLVKKLHNGEITKIKIIGDSQSEGYGATGHVLSLVNTNNGKPIIFNDNAGTIWYEPLYTDPSWANLFRNYITSNFPSVSFVNAGIGGKTTTWALANKSSWIGTEDVVFVMLGTNDKYNSGTDLANYKSELTQFLAYVKSHCNTMIVMTPHPPTDEYDSLGNRLSHARFTTSEMDRVITEICTENEYSHISLYREILKYCESTGFNVAFLGNEFEGPHANDLCHELTWRTIQNKLGFIDSEANWRDKIKNNDRQILINADFQIAQAVPVVGTEVTNPAYNSYPVCDMWKLEGYTGGGDTMPTIKHSQRKITDSGAEIGAVPGAKYCYRINVDAAGSTANSQYNLCQLVERGVSRFCIGSKFINATFWARSSISGKKIRVAHRLDYGTGGTPSATQYTNSIQIELTNTWTKYAMTIPIPDLTGKVFGTNDDDIFSFRFLFADSSQNWVGAGDIEITKVRMAADWSNINSVPRSFDEDLRDCMRYYQKSYNYNVAPLTAGNFAGAELCIQPSNTVVAGQSFGKIRFKAKMRSSTTPTVTTYSITTPTAYKVSAYNGTDLGTNSGAVSYVNDDGFNVYNNSGGSVTTTGNAIVFHWVANNRL